MLYREKKLTFKHLILSVQKHLILKILFVLKKYGKTFLSWFKMKDENHIQPKGNWK